MQLGPDADACRARASIRRDSLTEFEWRERGETWALIKGDVGLASEARESGFDLLGTSTVPIAKAIVDAFLEVALRALKQRYH